MAMASGTDNKAFQNLQISLNNLALQASAPEQLMPQVGVLEAVTSPANTQGLAALQFEVLNGKDKPQNTSGKPYVQVRSVAPDCTYTNTGSKNICTAETGASDPFVYTNVTVDQEAWREFTIDHSTFANLDYTPNEMIALKTAQACQNILTQINNSLGTLIYAQAGDYPSGGDSASSPKGVSIISSAGAYQPLALSQVITEYRKNGFAGKPIAVGGSKLETARMAAMYQGTGQFTSPYNPGLPVDLFTDYVLDATLGNSIENMITWMPGTVRLVEWFKNEKYNALNLETHKANKIMYGGFEFDCDIVYTCDKTWKFTISKPYGLFHVTEAMYDTCWNPGILAWELTCAGLDCTSF